MAKIKSFKKIYVKCNPIVNVQKWVFLIKKMAGDKYQNYML